jgi:hypothetical protein
MFANFSLDLMLIQLILMGIKVSKNVSSSFERSPGIADC